MCISPLRCSIDYVSFSAHVDFVQNMSFIRAVMPDTIVLVHGEREGMGRLKAELEREHKRNGWFDSAYIPRVAMPSNGQTVQLSFKKPVSATAVGAAAEVIAAEFDALYKHRSLELAEQQRAVEVGLEGAGGMDVYGDINRDIDVGKGDDEGRGVITSSSSSGGGVISSGEIKSSTEKVSGLNAPMLVGLPPSSILVGQNFTYKIVKIDDLESYTPLRRGKLVNRQHIAIPAAAMQLFASASGTTTSTTTTSSSGASSTAILPLLAVYPYLHDVFHDMDASSLGAAHGKDARIDITYHYASVGETIKLESNEAGSGNAPAEFEAIYTCSDKDFITIGDVFRVSYYNPSGHRNRFHSLVIEWNANPLVDWAAEAAVCCMTYALSVENALRITTSIDRLEGTSKATPSQPHSSSSFSPGNTSSTTLEHLDRSGHHPAGSADVIERMRTGVIDPSIASDLASVNGDVVSKAKLARIRDLLVASYCHSDANGAIPTTKVDSKKRSADTAKDLDLTQKSCWFKSVLLDASGKRLIIQSRLFEDPRNSAKSSIKGPAEAYVFIEWGRNQPSPSSCKACHHVQDCGHIQHHAVIQCDHDGFRDQVAYALQHLDVDGK
jgi:hypothetical protein